MLDNESNNGGKPPSPIPGFEVPEGIGAPSTEGSRNTGDYDLYLEHTQGREIPEHEDGKSFGDQIKDAVTDVLDKVTGGNEVESLDNQNLPQEGKSTNIER